VARRAARLCEYCLIHEDDTYFGCEVDHIISEKHGGPTVLGNLAYACAYCNRNKGSDLGSIPPDTRQLVRFYNPRRDVWSEHFRIEDAVIIPLTDIGRVTERILRFNLSDRILERRELALLGRYPPPAAARPTQPANE
jgi:hypothetical protein